MRPAMNSTIQCKIRVPSEGVTFGASCTEIGDSVFRLDSIPYCVESMHYKDCFRGEWNKEILCVLEIVENTNWRTFSFIFSKGSWETPKLPEILRKIEVMGGVWERVFGGLLFICIPPGVPYDPSKEVGEL